MERPTVLLLGATGLLGGELLRALDSVADVVVAPRAPGTPGRADLLDAESLRDAVARARPRVVLNAAGWADVDGCERDPGRAHALNADGPAALAGVCRTAGALLVHWSTDYVFDGRAGRPYREDDPTNPLSVYGRAKLVGEEAVRAVGAAHLILRTSWLYARHGKGFVPTLERRLSEEREVEVLADQQGSPTWVRVAAEACRDLLLRLEPFAGARGLLPDAVGGTYHVACRGPATWFDAAEVLRARWGSSAVLRRGVRAPGPGVAARPSGSALDPSRVERTFGLALPGWREALERCLATGTPPRGPGSR